jgi:hypothetical protein
MAIIHEAQIASLPKIDTPDNPMHRGDRSVRTMFDFRHILESLLDSERAVALVKVHPKSRPRHARTGCVAGLDISKFWRFRASDFNGRSQGGEHTAIDYQLEQRYSVLNHSCPQQRRR